ncbi:hypothetical protein D9M69_712530 [compost metagenome]
MPDSENTASSHSTGASSCHAAMTSSRLIGVDTSATMAVARKFSKPFATPMLNMYDERSTTPRIRNPSSSVWFMPGATWSPAKMNSAAPASNTNSMNTRCARRR